MPIRPRGPAITDHRARAAYDELRIRFLARIDGHATRTVLVVGQSRGAGATTTAVHFAAALAEDRDTRVLLIDADAGSGSLSQAFDPDGPADSNLFLLALRTDVLAPAVTYTSRRFRELLQRAAAQADFVLLDGRPLDDAPDSLALCRQVDGVLLVADASRGRRRDTARAVRRIQEVGGKLIGVVLNRCHVYVPPWLYRWT